MLGVARRFYEFAPVKPIKKSQDNPDPIDWQRWVPFACEESYVKAYFDFGKLEEIKDTDGKRIRKFVMGALLDSLVKNGHLPGHVAECGCYLGHSSYIIANILKSRGFLGAFHIFDSFEGLSNISNEDIQPLADGPGADELMRLCGPKDGVRRFCSDQSRVQRNLAGFDFIEIHPGWIPTQFGRVSDCKFVFVNIDVDLYQPTLESLAFFYPRLVEGGALYIDDYGVTSWPGCTRAVNEWLKTNSPRMALPLPGVGLVVIK